MKLASVDLPGAADVTATHNRVISVSDNSVIVASRDTECYVTIAYCTDVTELTPTASNRARFVRTPAVPDKLPVCSELYA